MKEIFEGLGIMCMVAVFAMILVIVAMGVDLVSGWRKAKLMGEAHTSYGFSRTLTKFLIYEGILLISVCIDLLLHFGLWQFIERNYVIPCVELMMAVVLCGVELWSVYEKAEDKQRRRMAEIAKVGVQAVDKEAAKGLLIEVLREAMKEKEKEGAEQCTG